MVLGFPSTLIHELTITHHAFLSPLRAFQQLINECNLYNHSLEELAFLHTQRSSIMISVVLFICSYDACWMLVW